MATISFQGISSGIKTDDYINAVLTQESMGLTKLQARQTSNTVKISTLGVFKSNINTLSISLAALQDKLVPLDKTATTAALQDVLVKFNATIKTYKDASVVTRGSDGSIVKGPLSGDSTTKSIVTQLRSTLTGVTSGVVSSYTNLASIGVKTNSDGTLTLNTSTFQTAIENDPAAVRSILAFSETQSFITNNVSSVSGNSSINSILTNITTQNTTLSKQISTAQSALARRKLVLQAQFSKMETIIAQLKAAAGQLGSIA